MKKQEKPLKIRGSIRWSIKVKLYLGFTLILLVVLSISVIAYYSLGKAELGTRRFQAEYDKLIDIIQIHSQLSAIKLSFKNLKFSFLAGGQKKEKIQELIQETQDLVKICENYLNHPKNSLENGYLQHLIGNGRELILFCKHRLLYRPEEILKAVPGNLEEMDEIVGHLKKQQEPKTKRRIKDLEERSKRHAIRFLMSGIVLSLGAAILFVYLFSQMIYNPLIRLYQGAKHISNGNLGYQLQLSSSDEIGELAQEFNLMSLQLKKSYEDLEAQLERRSEKLKEIENQLSRSERLASVGRLAAGVAHEINNPLTLIGACTDGLLNRSNDKNLTSIAAFQPFPEYLQKIDEEVYRCKKITKGLLNFAKEQSPEIKEVEIHELILNTILLLNQEARKQQKKLRLEGSKNQAKVYIDPFMLKQILINLVINALEASKIDTEVVIRYSISDSELIIEVEDEGEGIKSAIIGKIFDPFFTTKESGIGLGLAICYGLAKKHGGFISGKSKGKGEGAIFLLHLPTNTIDQNQETPSISPEKEELNA